jgi:hypothetical protein
MLFKCTIFYIPFLYLGPIPRNNFQSKWSKIYPFFASTPSKISLGTYFFFLIFSVIYLLLLLLFFFPYWLRHVKLRKYSYVISIDLLFIDQMVHQCYLNNVKIYK